MRLVRYSLNHVQGLMVTFLFILLLLFLLSSCATAPIPEERGKSLAVWHMEALSPASSRFDVGDLLSARVVEVLKDRGDYTVVEREQLVHVLEELRIGSSSLADEQTGLKIGKMVGARFMVFGGYLVMGEKMRLDLRLVEVETGRVLRAVQKTASSNDISAWLDAAGKAAAEL